MAVMSTRQLEEKKMTRDMIQTAINNPDQAKEILERALRTLDASIEKDINMPWSPVS